MNKETKGWHASVHCANARERSLSLRKGTQVLSHLNQGTGGWHTSQIRVQGWSPIVRTHRSMAWSTIERMHRLMAWSTLERTHRLMAWSTLERTHKLMAWSTLKRTLMSEALNWMHSRAHAQYATGCQKHDMVKQSDKQQCEYSLLPGMVAARNRDACMCCEDTRYFILELYVRSLLTFHEMFCRMIYHRDHVSRKIKILGMMLQRNMMRKHDFAYLFIHAAAVQEDALRFIDLFVLCNVFAVWLLQVSMRCIRLLQAWQTKESSRATHLGYTSQTDCFIGGGSNTFLFHEIMGYLDNNIHSETTEFRFQAYIPNSHSGQPQFLGPNICVCDIPLSVIVGKLTVAELRVVAACHGICIPSKLQRACIQAKICVHECRGCGTYTSVFDVIDKKPRSQIVLNASKNYQQKQGEEYKKRNLTSVKKNQEKQGGHYKLANLKSAKRYQEKEGKEYKTANSDSAKKYQEKLGEEYRIANLNSAINYQERKGRDYKTANLEAVTKYQGNQSDEYKASNLEAAKKYQENQSEEYKASNLVAVQKYQENQGEEYDASHLVAAKKYQENQIKEHKASNLVSVQKYQENQSERYKASNLISVQKYQENQSEEYKASHLVAAMKYQEKKSDGYKTANLGAVKKYQEMQGDVYAQSHLGAVHKNLGSTSVSDFPPSAPTSELQHTILYDACNSMSPTRFTEMGCTVCGRLTPISELQSLANSRLDLRILINPYATRQERFSEADPISCLPGPVIERTLSQLCKTCHHSIAKGKVPSMALANGNWIGDIPKELADLTFAEQLLVARVRHNRCIVRVSSGMHKMRANAISFTNPIAKVYDTLPPPIKDIDEVLAFIYTGPCRPTKADFERTPLLVRRRQVRAALDWLKLNHCDYHDLDISQRNLDQYPEGSPPVVVDYRQSFTNTNPESSAVNDNEDEEGTETGKCPFVVHGLTGEEYTTKSIKAIKAIALKHLTSNRKMLAVGHTLQPESIYDNPQLFPQMLPWLFPYGLGGIGNVEQQGNSSDIAYKRHLLMYHDKRFQTDPYFPLIAFNHEQIKQSTTGGYLLARKSMFEDISKRLMDVDTSALSHLAKRMEEGERVTPVTDDEKACFQLMRDLDHVGGHVKGSVTSKKYMRNEIWSLVSFIGAPSWFITFSPADVKHPIALYFADTQETFQPALRQHDERYLLIAHNPVAGARFFHFMCNTFIKHVLGVGTNHSGMYGETDAYYGTVEQQGRLTLHMHMLLWIKGSLTPQEIRDKIMDPVSGFQQRMVEYLEGVHIGEFLTGSMEQVKEELTNNSCNPNYKDPTQTLPEAPPPICHEYSENCTNCACLDTWWHRFRCTVDDLIFRSNVHNCRKNQGTNDGVAKARPTCINKHGNCKARFPRELYEQTEVDPKTGALNMRKGEQWINTITPLVTYILRCNTDVTSLLSGTAIKAIVAYISDYVTKPGLKTYSIFDVIRSVFDRNSEMLGGSLERKEKARRLIIQIVNSLTAKMEIGGPMASLYLLGNPDHYTSHKFNTVYWKDYVREAMKAWKTTDDKECDEQPEKLVLHRNENQYIGVSHVYDFIYRPEAHTNKTLYEWLQMATRVANKAASKAEQDSDELDLIEPDTFVVRSMSGPKPPLNSVTAMTVDEVSDDELNIQEEDRNELFGDSTYNISQQMDEPDVDKSQVFLQSHPLHRTHIAQFDATRINLVPNFVGGSLPRCDKGDREYYCATMLALFKPWRTGKDLKSEGYSWDEAFTDHKFSPQQQQLLCNFNIRYECNDARDDYSAQLKKGAASDGVFPQWMSSEVISKLDDDMNEYDDFGDSNEGTGHCSTLGPYGKVQEAQMVATENSVRNAGWLDESPDGIATRRNAMLEPEIVQPSQSWKAAVQGRRQEVLAERNKNIPAIQHRNTNNSLKDKNENNVTIIDQSYLNRNFKFKSQTDQLLIDQIVCSWRLNTGQERAFRIIANHAVSAQSGQLKMYLGGMGGTGKSQVIKALTDLFTKRNEAHRLVVLGPTGTSAALLGGSTYHSFLGIRPGDHTRNNSTTIAQVKARLEGVDYIFIDEVSMLACHELYKISSQLAKALNVDEVPFGGINIIFAGDFAQLPPVGGASLYSGNVGTQVNSATTPHHQEAAIGKAIWHQITTVVILRENMRQKTQTAEDAALCKALVNMRYGKCTSEDIQFLRSRIAGRRPKQPKVSAKAFRNVAIICGLHTQKDRINQLGCERFALENKQGLTHFYAVDKWGKESDPATKKKWGKSEVTSKLKHISNEINSDDQIAIWKLRHGATDHFPRKLSLCVGMPVMIRNNDATELCITKGQEGLVAGWQAIKGPHGKHVLDTLFVELENPPQLVQIPGLPDNVVPIVKSTKTIPCVFPNDAKVSIERQQVWVLPNFAMTAHAAQGKTRPYNVVHLNSCHTHMAYYTALSRSATADGTIIIQGFDAKVITSGCSGYLRQEFREHEVLDDITRLRYEGLLPDDVNGQLRNTLLCQYQHLKGTEHVPADTDALLHWSSHDPLSPLPMTINTSKFSKQNKIESTTIATKKHSVFTPAKGSLPVTTGQKRKLEDVETLSVGKMKQLKITDKPQTVSSPVSAKESMSVMDGEHEVKVVSNHSTEHHQQPTGVPPGTVWDADNRSCAYDALFGILYDIWRCDPVLWSGRFRMIDNDHLLALAGGFQLFTEHNTSLEDVRDHVRLLLHTSSPDQFPLGNVGASVADLAYEMLRTEEILACSQQVCTNCNFEGPEEDHILGHVVSAGQSPRSSTSRWINMLDYPSRRSCPECLCNMTKAIYYKTPPKLLIMDYCGHRIRTSRRLEIEDPEPATLHLRGIVYLGGEHFTSRRISTRGKVWYHDGITTGRRCEDEGSVKSMNDEKLQTCKKRVAVLAVYAQM